MTTVALPGTQIMPCRPIVIGASTGGVEALYTVLAGLPKDCPPTFVVQHMRPNYVEGFVAGLNRACCATVAMAADREPARTGYIYVAPPGDYHLELAGQSALIMRLVQSPPVQGHRPAADRLFQSAAQLPRPPAAALLTGMGRDGAEGLLCIRHAGGPTIAQDEATSIVYGMPRAARDINAADHILPLPAIAGALLKASGYQSFVQQSARK